MSDLHLQEATTDSSRRKKVPKPSDLPLPFSYSPSDDGTDENILILLHGLGDSHIPYFKLGRSLNLPQTAVLSLRAPEQIPYLYEQAFQWYESFDPLGELLPNPNPSSALDVLAQVIDKLITDFGWPVYRIHFFGYAQGGSVSAELGIRWWKSQVASSPSTSPLPFGSIISVSGPLLSYPTMDRLSTTPILIVYRKPPAEGTLSKSELMAFEKAYQRTRQAALEGSSSGMPSSKDEWDPIMRFWSEMLGRRQVDGLYEVLSGTAPVTV